MPEKQLADLFEYVHPLSPVPDLVVAGMHFDSRQIKPGDAFIAFAGKSMDGHNYIPQALENGAVLIVGTQPASEYADIAYVQVADSRYAMAQMAAAFYDYPAEKLTLVGVTGTDGKTTTSNLIFHIMKAAGLNAGMISTVNAVIGDEVLDTGFHVTTPEAIDVQRYLAQMVDAGLTHAVLETTSHGLDQLRVIPEEFSVGVLTNITHAHLNDHGESYENYRAAKARLFLGFEAPYNQRQSKLQLAVLNREDDYSYAYLAERTTARQVAYGLTQDAEVIATDMEYTPQGLSFTAKGPGFEFPVASDLIGAYNVSNILAAISATVIGLDISPEAAVAGIKALPGIPGRMEYIDLGQDFIAMADFAHTPNALKVTLEAAREITPGKIIAAFGSAGLRDRQKRFMMAEISAELADITILTAEDPRTESLDTILAEMAQGAERKGAIEHESYYRVPDRGEAIRLALKLAAPGDIVLILGKGHEQSMCFDVTEHPWDDRTALRAALAEYLGVDGPAMPYLPTQDELTS